MLQVLQAPGHKAPPQKLATVPESEDEDVEGAYVLDDSASSLSDSSHADLHDDDSVSQSRRRAGSIASTYWRPERRDRTELSSVLDDRCASNIAGILSCGTQSPSVDKVLPLYASQALHL